MFFEYMGIIKLVLIIPFLLFSFVAYIFSNIYSNVFLFKLVKYPFYVLYLILGLWMLGLYESLYLIIMLCVILGYILWKESEMKAQKFVSYNKIAGKRLYFYIELFNENFIFAGRVRLSFIKFLFSFGLKFVKSIDNIDEYRDNVHYILDNISGSFCEIESKEALIKFYS